MSIKERQILEEADSIAALNQLVMEIQRSPRRRTIRFQVLEPFRGVTEPELTMETDQPGVATCAPGFNLDEEYIVYAYQRGQYGPITTGYCTRTTSAVNAGSDLEFWRAFKKSPKAGRIYGKVHTSGPVLGSSTERAEVIVEGQEVTRRTATDEGGSYSFDDLPAGTYKVSAVFERLEVRDSPRQASVVDGSCSEQDFRAFPLGQIIGDVVDASGSPIAAQHLEIIAVPPTRSPESSMVITNEGGHFQVDRLAPGQYLLGINASQPPTAREFGFNRPSPYPKTYFPNGSTETFAQRIEIRTGEGPVELRWTLPPRLEEKVIEGRVVWSDGEQVSAGRVDLRDPDYEHWSTHALRLPADGKFQLVGFKGYTYELQVDASQSYSRKGFDRFRKTIIIHPEDRGPFTVVLDAASTERP